MRAKTLVMRCIEFHVKGDITQKLEPTLPPYFWVKQEIHITASKQVDTCSVWLAEEGVRTETHPWEDGCQWTDSKSE